MGELEGAYAIWLREITIYFREKERIVASIVSPLLWIFGFGAGLGASVAIAGVNYQTYVLPGIMVMTVLFTSVFFGLYVIWDRKLDFLKEVLVSPVSRSWVFIGKMLGGVSDSIIQSLVIFIVAILLSIPLTPLGFLASLLAVFLTAVCMTSVGLFFGAILSSIESFQLVSNFVVWPLFIFSGALFPISNLPSWLQALTSVDPLTYAVDALRGSMLSAGAYSYGYDIGILAIFCVLAIAIGSWAFNRMGKL